MHVLPQQSGNMETGFPAMNAHPRAANILDSLAGAA